jgi:hypothetical protein
MKTFEQVKDQTNYYYHPIHAISLLKQGLQLTSEL